MAIRTAATIQRTRQALNVLCSSYLTLFVLNVIFISEWNDVQWARSLQVCEQSNTLAAATRDITSLPKQCVVLI